MLLFTDMLDNRTNVLLDDDLSSYVAMKAEWEKTTAGEVMRRALRQMRDGDKDMIDYQLLKRIKASWKRVKHPEKRIDYKAWVEYGRK